MLRRDELRALLAGFAELELKWGEPLARYTTFRVGGPVLCLVRPRTEQALVNLIGVLKTNELPYFILGGGSNLLLPDDEWSVLAIQLDLCSANLVVQEDRGVAGAALSVGAGVRLSRLLRYCLLKGFGGLEFLVGIPGMLGGALVMNAGTKAGSIADALLWIEVLDEDNRRRRIARSELSPHYRSLGLPDNWVILSGCLEVSRCSRESHRARLAALLQERKKTQPLGWPSAGCIFKNPEGFAAGALIEKSGLKGMRLGDAEVSFKHANWIVNRGRAKTQDILALIEHIQKRVEQDSGIRLEKEIRIMGL